MSSWESKEFKTPHLNTVINNHKPIFVTSDRLLNVFTKIWERLEGGPSDGGIQASSVHPSEYFININLFRVFQNHLAGFFSVEMSQHGIFFSTETHSIFTPQNSVKLLPPLKTKRTSRVFLGVSSSFLGTLK